MHLLSAAAVLIFLAQSATAQTDAAQLAKPEDQVTLAGIYAAAKADCATFDNGVFSPGDSPVAESDLTGDGKPEQIVNFAGFQCSTLAGYYFSTGGSPIVVLADGKRWVWTALSYQIVKVPDSPQVLLLMVHGGECGGTGSDPCFDAVVWNSETFLGVRPEQDQ